MDAYLVVKMFDLMAVAVQFYVWQGGWWKYISKATNETRFSKHKMNLPKWNISTKRCRRYRPWKVAAPLHKTLHKHSSTVPSKSLLKSDSLLALNDTKEDRRIVSAVSSQFHFFLDAGVDCCWHQPRPTQRNLRRHYFAWTALTGNCNRHRFSSHRVHNVTGNLLFHLDRICPQQRAGRNARAPLFPEKTVFQRGSKTTAATGAGLLLMHWLTETEGFPRSECQIPCFSGWFFAATGCFQSFS